MYSVSSYRHALEDLVTEKFDETELPLVSIPVAMRPKFLAMDTVPLYYFNYVERVNAKGRRFARVIALSSKQLVVCDYDGCVKRCIDLDEIVDVTLDQNTCMEESDLRDKRMTRVYIRTQGGYNLYIRLVRKVLVFLQALSSLSDVRVGMSNSYGGFDSCVDTKSLVCPMKSKPKNFCVPDNNFAVNPEMRDRQLELDDVQSSRTPRSRRDGETMSFLSTPPSSPTQGTAQILSSPNPSFRVRHGSLTPKTPRSGTSHRVAFAHAPSAVAENASMPKIPAAKRRNSSVPPPIPLDAVDCESHLMCTVAMVEPNASAATPCSSVGPSSCDDGRGAAQDDAEGTDSDASFNHLSAYMMHFQSVKKQA